MVTVTSGAGAKTITEEAKTFTYPVRTDVTPERRTVSPLMIARRVVRLHPRDVP
jgi:hypothetical protein